MLTWLTLRAGVLGGAKWEGSRVTFDGAAEQTAGASSPPAPAEAAAAAAAPLSGLAEQLEAVKWRKLTVAALQQARLLTQL